MKIYPHMLRFLALLAPEASMIEKYMEQPKCTKCRYVIQSHIRGESQHMDVRLEMNDHLVGWTITGGNATSPITPERLRKEKHRAEPKCPSEVCDEWKFTLVSVDEDGTPHLVEKKEQNLFAIMEDLARQPKDWLKVQGEFKPGEVGAGTKVSGRMKILDRGHVYFGAQKPYFHEYFLDGEVLKKTRLVIRAIPTQRIDPESKEKIKGTAEVMWNAWIPEDTVPYAIDRGRKKGWKPPKGTDPIPPWWREEHKEEYEDWKAWRSGKEKTEEEALSKLDAPPEKKTFSFTLQRSAYKGPTHVRDMPKVSYWIFLRDGGSYLYRLDSNPLFISETFASHTGEAPEKWMGFEGEVPPGTEPFNPTKELPADMEVLDRGKASAEITSEKGVTLFTLHFKGKKLTGTWVLQQEEKGAEIFRFAHLSEDPLDFLKVIDIFDILPKFFPRRKKKEEDMEEKETFVLQHHSWDGKEHWDLRFLVGGKPLYWNLLQDPRGKGIEEKVPAYKDICGDASWMEKGRGKEEKVMIGKTETSVLILDSGTSQVFEENPSFMSFKLFGKSLRGYFILKKTDQHWFFAKSELPEAQAEEE